jgi:mannose-6-phosphate isomerase-like protein (cupin superfamily)
MNDEVKYIESGILEMYVMGQTTPEETTEVEEMAAMYDSVRDEIDSISNALEQYTSANAIEPPVTIFPFLMATIDYMERMKHGESPTFPPMLHVGSKIADYARWLNREDLQPAKPVTDMHASIIGYTPEVTTAIIWLKDGAPPETHTNELEKFLIVEGTCDITIDKNVHKMKPGEVLSLPLYVSHNVRVTSDYPCKIILQRMAA